MGKLSELYIPTIVFGIQSCYTVICRSVICLKAPSLIGAIRYEHKSQTVVIGIDLVWHWKIWTWTEFAKWYLIIPRTSEIEMEKFIYPVTVKVIEQSSGEGQQYVWHFCAFEEIFLWRERVGNFALTIFISSQKSGIVLPGLTNYSAVKHSVKRNCEGVTVYDIKSFFAKNLCLQQSW